MFKPIVCAAALLLAACNQAKAQDDMRACDMYVNFESPQSIRQWRAVNDGVMGGLSSGGPRFENEYMVFEGVINTNGGGFSSVRTPIVQGELAEAKGLKLRVKSDGRAYKVTMRTDVAYRGRLISFQVPIPLSQKGEWTESYVSFDELNASIFGRSVRGATFNPARVKELGIILADEQDGPFRLDVEWIKSCQ